MELYYKDLISKDASLEKLVDELNWVVQGAEEVAAAAAAAGGLTGDRKEELASRVQRLKETCRRIQQQTTAGALATDKVLRANPYLFAGAAFAAGLLAGALFMRKARRSSERI